MRAKPCPRLGAPCCTIYSTIDMMMIVHVRLEYLGVTGRNTVVRPCAHEAPACAYTQPQYTLSTHSMHTHYQLHKINVVYCHYRVFNQGPRVQSCACATSWPPEKKKHSKRPCRSLALTKLCRDSQQVPFLWHSSPLCLRAMEQ